MGYELRSIDEIIDWDRTNAVRLKKSRHEVKDGQIIYKEKDEQL